MKRAATVVSWVLLCTGLHAQQRLLFDHLTVKQGLSQATVTCILQDSWGFMWFGTQDGLNRFDGYSFTVFKHDAADPHSLGGNFIVFIGEDRAGTLWIGSLSDPGSLSRFDRVSESFTAAPRDSVDLNGAQISSTSTSCIDTAGVRWSGTLGGGVTRFDPRTGTTTSYTHDPSNPKSLTDNKVHTVYRDHGGAIWVATRGGLDRFDAGHATFIHYKHDDADPKSLSDNWVWPILEDRSGSLWVGTVRGGLNRLDRKSGTFSRFTNVPSDPGSISDDRILSLYEDRSGMMWVGTGDHGTDRFRPDPGAFKHFFNEPSNPGSLSDNNVSPILVDRTGAVWLGTTRGLDKFDPATTLFKNYRRDPRTPESLGEDTPCCLYEDRAGNLWIGTFSNGIDTLNGKTGKFTHFRHEAGKPASLSDNRVYAMCEDADGIIWAGTYGGGLNRFDRLTGTFSAFVHNDSLPGSLGAPGVWSLCLDRKGVLWVGTYGGGLDMFNKDAGTFRHYRHDDANPSTLSDDNVLCIYEDRAGTMWVGTFNGLNRFDREKGSFKCYREKDGLPNALVYGILEDEHANLWLSTNKGISRFDPQREIFRNYEENDGLQANEFNQNAYAVNRRSGMMYFGGANGFNEFHPDSVRDNGFVPPVVFTSFARYNTDDAEGKPIQEKGIAAKSEIQLSYKDNIANIEFAALSYYNTFKNQYAYKLEGFSDGWIRLGTERRATFTNLDAGDYTLRVRGSNNDGIWNDQGASLRIVVTPPWWKTRWAYASYFMMAFGLLYGARRVEINRREQKAQIRESALRAKAVEAEKRALQAENERKTRELEDARLLQLSMLPKEVPRLPGYEIAVFMKTATEVGGDYYDFSVAEEGTLNIAFGDATGHGMQAGTIVTLMKGLFLSDAARFDIPTFFRRCTATMKEIRLGRLFMAFTLVKMKGDAVSFSCAGMPPAYYYRQRAGNAQEILLQGMPLGAMKNISYVLHEATMEPGDTLLFLTDGLPEQKNADGTMFDYARVQQAFTDAAGGTPDEIIRHLVREGDSWMNGATQDDDITFLVIKKKA